MVDEITAFVARKMNPIPNPGFFTVIFATLQKDLRIVRRYIPNLIGNIVQLAIRVLFFLLLSHTASFQGKNSLSNQDLFIFFLCSMLLWVLIGTALQTPLNAVHTDLMNGTLEYLYTNPISRYAYYMGTVIAGAAVNMIFFTPFYILLSFLSKAGAVQMAMVALVCLLTLAALISFGIMIALLALLWRQIGAIAGVIHIVFEFIAGAYVPVDKFPAPLHYLAYLVPFTWGYDLIRFYSLKQWTPLAPIAFEWLILGIFALIYTALSVVLLKKVESLSKKNGLHLI